MYEWKFAIKRSNYSPSQINVGGVKSKILSSEVLSNILPLDAPLTI